MDRHNSPYRLPALFASALILFSLAVLLRVGVLANVAMAVVAGVTKNLPLTLDTHAWYFGQSLLVLLLIGALATYGFSSRWLGVPHLAS